jgi:formiminotetrahydrofolate cyclodeaminase
MTLVEQPLRDVLAAFQAGTPTPGGGSAAALTGALGSSLLAMVASLPRNRAATPEERGRLLSAAERCRAHAAALALAVDEDRAAYEEVVAAYRLPKDTDGEKAERASRVQQGLRRAIAVPLAVMRRCAGSAVLAETVAALGNRNAASDVGTALELLGAGLRSARLNVEANLGAMKDGKYSASIAGDADRLTREFDAAAAAARARLREPG